MSDFYSILRKSILDRGIANSSERTAIYAQARRAMIRRLWSFEPPLDGDEVERRIAAFDVAVSDIEADVMAAFSDGDEAPAEDDYTDDPAEAAPYASDSREADYDDTDYRAADRYPADPYAADRYHEDAYREDDRVAETYPVANPRRLPALPDPATFGRQVREAGLVRYYEQAPHAAPPQPRYEERYDDRYTEPFADPVVEDPPPTIERAASRRALPEPPVDPYEDEPGYGEEARAATRRRRQADRWTQEGPRREARDAPRRKAVQVHDPRRLGPDDDLPRRRQRKRPSRQPLSDRDKIYMLLGAIGVCVLVLGGIGTYLLLPRDSGVTVDIDRREVSDAATAVRLAAAAMKVDQTFMLFDGRDPTVFETSPDNPIHFDAAAGTVRISSSPTSPGVKALIGPGLAVRLGGHDVRVTIVARSSKDAGAASMRFAYQSGVAISHWQTANLGADYQAVALTWRVPAMQTDRNGDLLVIQPGVPGDGTGADIKSIKIDVIQGQS